MSDLTHFDDDGRAHMVDVGAKPDTERVAIARGRVSMAVATRQLIENAGLKKGDVLSVAQLAGIMGAKRTPDLIPLCHPLSLTSVAVELAFDQDQPSLSITATVKTLGKTGVEMEALTAVSIAALTVYDMCKAVDRGMVLEQIEVIHKSGGKSGIYDKNS